MPTRPPFFLIDARLHLMIVIGLLATWAASEPEAAQTLDDGSSMVAMAPPPGPAEGHNSSSCGCHAYRLPTGNDAR